MTILFLIGLALSFLLSSVVGMGGSLIAVPLAVMAFGPKIGVAMAALLLLGNNIVKVFAYRNSIPWKGAAGIALITMLSTFLGAKLLVALPERWVIVAVIISLLWSFVAEIKTGRFAADTERANIPGRDLWSTDFKRGSSYALAAGLCSGVSGTSGPLKGVAIRQWVKDPAYFAGAASLVSLVGDLTKAAVFAQAALYPSSQWPLMAAAIPLMLICPFIGLAMNRHMGQRAFSALFWLVIAGYGLRLVVG
jgi:uncharacterized membrane protein YfcA